MTQGIDFGGVGIAAPATLFANEAWAVTADGLEHRGTGYFIAREDLGQRRSDGLWTWPVHMAEKLWCAAPDFAEAFMQAVRAYGLEPDAGLALSFHDAGRIKGEQARHALHARDEDAIELPPGRRPPLRPRPEAPRDATAHPWRRFPIARAGLTLLDWLRQRAAGA